MKRIDEGLLLAAAAGALDPGRARALADQLALRPADADRLRRLQSELEPDRATARGWTLPPSGSWGFATARPLRAEPVLHMDGSRALRAGARVRLSLPDTAGIADPRLLVLWRGGGDWRCMVPRPGQPAIPVEQIRPDDTGVRSIEVVMQAEAARQHWAVVILSEAPDVDWADEAAVAEMVLESVAQRTASLDVVPFDVEID